MRGAEDYRNKRTRYLSDELGDEALGFAVGVEVGGIDRVDAEVPCGFHEIKRWFFVKDPRLNEGDHMGL